MSSIVMPRFNRSILFASIVFAVVSFCGCGGTVVSPKTDAPAAVYDGPTIVSRPDSIVEMMGKRGEQDRALPELKIYEPKPNAVVESSTVKVSLELGGILKGFSLSPDSDLNRGNHIRIFLDDDRHGEIRSIDENFEFRDVADGAHTLAVVPVRPWGESYKNDGAMQIVRFTVKTGSGQTPATAQPNQLPDIDGPLLKLINPLKASEKSYENPVPVDFTLANVRLADRGGNYRVALSISGGPVQYLEKLEAIWIAGLKPGSNKIRVELVDRNGKPVVNGTWNSVEREFLVSK